MNNTVNEALRAPITISAEERKFIEELVISFGQGACMAPDLMTLTLSPERAATLQATLLAGLQAIVAGTAVYDAGDD